MTIFPEAAPVCCDRRTPTADFPAFAAFVAQVEQGTHAAFVAGATRLDALAYPDFLLRKLLVE